MRQMWKVLQRKEALNVGVTVLLIGMILHTTSNTASGVGLVAILMFGNELGSPTILSLIVLGMTMIIIGWMSIGYDYRHKISDETREAVAEITVKSKE